MDGKRPSTNPIKRAAKQLRELCPYGASQEKVALENPHKKLNEALGGKNQSCESAFKISPMALGYKRCSKDDPLLEICCEKCIAYRMNNCTEHLKWIPAYMYSTTCENQRKTCEDFGNRNPCYNDGKCVTDTSMPIVAFKCICKEGFKGKFISIIVYSLRYHK